jgi:hypothetical protein
MSVSWYSFNKRRVFSNTIAVYPSGTEFVLVTCSEIIRILTVPGSDSLHVFVPFRYVVI